MPFPRKRLFRFPWRSARQISEEVDAEIAFHLEMRAADLRDSGLEEAEAYRQARAEFGNLEFTRDYCATLDRRGEQRIRLADRLSELRQDLTQAWRATRGNSGFVAVAVLTLGLAIGANTAIFGALRAVLFRPLPYGEPRQLVALFETAPSGATLNPISALNLLDYRAGQHRFTGLAGYFARSVTWRPDGGDPELLQALSITGNTFAVLQVSPLLGRPFTETDETPGEPKAIVSYGFWKSALGGDSGVVGRSLILNDLTYRVVGVMPRGFAIDGREALWTPLGFARELANPAEARRDHSISVIARLRPGTAIVEGEADLVQTSRQLEARFPEANTGRTARAVPLREVFTGDLGPGLFLLQGASLLLLLIACVNLANLALARGLLRRRELALRAALGAGRLRLLRQLLMESLVVAFAGGALGVLLAIATTRVLLALQPEALPALFPIRPDSVVLLFAFLLSSGTGIAVGLLPAFDASSPDLRAALQGGNRSSVGREGQRVRHILVVSQVALAVMLLVGAGLLLRSFAEISRVNLGFDADHILTAEVRVSGERYDAPPMVNGFYDRLLAGLRHRPGVVAVGATMKLPAAGQVSRPIRVEGEPVDLNRLPEVGLVLVRGDYFQALHIPLVSGRLLGPEDQAEGPHTVVINRAAARRLFPTGDALGRRVRLGADQDEPWSTVVGVVGDVREEGLAVIPGPTVYANHGQNTWWRSLTLVIRTSGDPELAEPLVRTEVRAADPTLALRNMRTLESALGAGLAARRFALQLVSAFAALALILAAVGIYGVLAFSVSHRTREFGVRLALGARPGRVLVLVVGQGVGWSLAGLLIGLAGALAGGRLLESRLYGVSPTDLVTLLGVGICLIVVAAVASFIPARRATRVDPIASLRGD